MCLSETDEFPGQFVPIQARSCFFNFLLRPNTISKVCHFTYLPKQELRKELLACMETNTAQNPSVPERHRFVSSTVHRTNT